MTDTTAVTLAGPADASPVVLLHGGGGNRQMWTRTIRELADRYRVIAPDLPGHGALRTQQFDLRRSRELVAATIDHAAGGRAAVVGLSLGGYVAIDLAARHPDRVSGLVLSGATAEYLGRGGMSTRLAAIGVRLGARWFDTKSAEAIRRIAPADIADPMLAAGLSSRGAADAFWRLPGHDFHAMLASYRGPVLILNGERDQENRKAEPAALASWPQARVEVILDAGHACAVSQPDRFTDAVRRFLDGMTVSTPGMGASLADSDGAEAATPRAL
jgi:pimeloyl-ACP methyl ester carboxylesterase